MTDQPQVELADEAKEIFDGVEVGGDPWANINFGTQEEERKKDVYPVFAKDIYIYEVVSMDLIERPGYMTEELEPQVEVTVKLLKNADGELPKYTDGEFAEKNFFKIWFRPDGTGYNRKTGAALPFRQFMTSILGLKETEAIPKFSPDDILGRKGKLMMEVAQKQNGDPKNKVTSYLILKA